VGSDRRPRAREAARAAGPGPPWPLRSVRRIAAARSSGGRSARRRRVVAVRVRRDRRAADDPLRARRQGRLLRALAVLHRSGRADLRRRTGRPQGRRPHPAPPRHRRQRACRRAGAPAGAAAARSGRLPAAAAARAALQRAPADEGGRRLPGPRRRPGRSLEGRRLELAVRAGPESRQGRAGPVGRGHDGRGVAGADAGRHAPGRPVGRRPRRTGHPDLHAGQRRRLHL
jgi:hypothetical protein